jgi:2-polyprenyl-3-methyl-5-hydroxy-6-metoxy-1,4-benzoquinol methylase
MFSVIHPLEIKIKKMNCKVCGNKMNLYFENCVDINFSMTRNVFNWHKCESCNLMSISPINNSLEVIEEYYNEYDPHKHGVKKLSKFSKSSINKVIKDLKKNQYESAEFTLLDVGCGAGNLLFNIRTEFNKSNLYGLDFNIKSATINLEGLGVKLFQGGLNDLNSDLKFDFIVSSQLLEHIDNPIDYVNFLSKHLKRNGVVYLDIPFIGSRSFRLFKNYWVHLDTPRHRNLFEISTLTQLFKDYELMQINKFGTGYAYLTSIINLMKYKFKFSQLSIKPFFAFIISKFIEIFIRSDDKLFIKLIKK